jgi:Flp pilus assembly protein TadB
VLDFLLAKLQLYPYRCGACNARSYARNRSVPAEVPLESDEPASKPAKLRHHRAPHRLRSIFKKLRTAGSALSRIRNQAVIYGLALVIFAIFLYVMIR